MTNKFYQCCLFVCLAFGLAAQGVVNPGDANNDGLVDHHDLLSVGYAFGSFGAPRQNGGPGGTQAYNLPWVGNFPNGLNFTFADADGNGQVDILDLLFVSLNDGNAFAGGFEITLPSGTLGVDSEVSLNEGSELDAQTVAGQNISIPLSVSNLPISTGVNGVALTLTIDTSLIDAFTFNFSEEWLLQDGAAFPFVRQEGNKIRIALSRFGPDPVAQPVGEIGTLSVTIIEDLVGLLPNTPDEPTEIISIDAIQLMDGNFEALPTVGRGLNIGALSSISSSTDLDSESNQIGLFPNPTNGQLLVQSQQQFSRVEIFDLNGKRQLIYQGALVAQRRLSLEDYSPGLYYLRLTDETWSSTVPLIKH